MPFENGLPVLDEQHSTGCLRCFPGYQNLTDSFNCFDGSMRTDVAMSLTDSGTKEAKRKKPAQTMPWHTLSVVSFIVCPSHEISDDIILSLTMPLCSLHCLFHFSHTHRVTQYLRLPDYTTHSSLSESPFVVVGS